MSGQGDRNIEVERKFLALGRGWAGLGRALSIRQGYLSTDVDRVVRVRVEDENGILTVKGRADGARRLEIECEIPLETARAILERPGLCLGWTIEKTRHEVSLGAFCFQVDEFHGANEGLVTVEVEYGGSDQGQDEWNERLTSEKPDWVGREVTGDPRLYNASLAQRPLSAWLAEDRDALLGEIQPEMAGGEQARTMPNERTQ